MCSLWLLSDTEDGGRFQLRAGNATAREGGASEFCMLSDALGGGNSLELEVQLPGGTPASSAAPENSLQGVAQSLQLTGLQLAEWRVFNARAALGATDTASIISSPPFRFHHVLLGDMYLEAQASAAGSELCTLFFRCRVPTMRLKVELSVGNSFSNSFIAEGKNTPEVDHKNGACLQVNLDIPDVVDADGTLVVRCALEEVVSMPASVRDMIPRLNERASWPKRL
jgi:hypothetical protein